MREPAPPLPEGGVRARHVGNIGRPHCDEPGFGGSLLIGSCDYVFDPLLTVVTVPVTCVVAAAVLPCALVVVPCQVAQKQQQELPPVEQSN